MIDRRQFLASSAASLLIAPWAYAQNSEQPKRLAVVTTLWKYPTHAWHMAERFLHGFPLEGRWNQPNIQVVSAYVDQRPAGDLSQDRADRYGFQVFPTVAEALRCGGPSIDVDAVLLIGEHGDYPVNEFGQKMYPRYELFSQITDVFRKDGKSVPVFNDKHLSWKFEWAREMVESSRKLKFPFLAGSSLPVTWRMPAIDMPFGAEVSDAMVVAYGPTDIYDFHALETLQCMLERRKGGETGISRVQAWRGPQLWQALDNRELPQGGWPPALFEACLSRSQTLKQAETFSHRYPTVSEIREWVKDPIYYNLQYRDGTLGHLLLLNSLVEDFTFAAKIKSQNNPISTLFYLPPTPNVAYSAALMNHAANMFLTGKASYPVERTLLTSGTVEACLHSLNHQKPQATPHLEFSYQPVAESLYVRS